MLTLFHFLFLFAGFGFHMFLCLAFSMAYNILLKVFAYRVKENPSPLMVLGSGKNMKKNLRSYLCQKQGY